MKSPKYMKKNKINCIACQNPTIRRKVILRDGSKRFINVCNSCGCQFFNPKKQNLIKSNDFENARLGKAGLEIPNNKDDFENGYIQSKYYIEKHIPKNFKNGSILEVGCSLGYFLKRVVDLDNSNKCEGVELNPVRARYVRENLNIPCCENLKDIKKKKYDFIFAFYVIEYIENPKIFLKKLVNLLSKNGKLILYTPNVNDPLKDIWELRQFRDFFYEKQSLNYFSLNSLEILIKSLLDDRLKYKISSIQAYSVFNHLRWYFEKKPKTTKIVGGDDLNIFLKDLFKKEDSQTSKIIELMRDFDGNYRQILEKNDFGNRILIEITKS